MKLIPVLKRDLKAVLRNPAATAQPVLFYFIITALFPLATSPGAATLRTMAPGIIWVSALLATLLALDNLFKSDHEDGTLDQLTILSESLAGVAIIRVLSHWLVTGLPLLVACTIAGYWLYIPEKAYPALVISLLLGTPTLSIIGAIGSALTMGLRYSGVLLTLIVMPLYIPVLIFGASCINAAVLGLAWNAQLYLLGALLVISLTLAPFAIAAALRINLG